MFFFLLFSFFFYFIFWGEKNFFSRFLLFILLIIIIIIKSSIKLRVVCVTKIHSRINRKILSYDFAHFFFFANFFFIFFPRDLASDIITIRILPGVFFYNLWFLFSFCFQPLAWKMSVLLSSFFLNTQNIFFCSLFSRRNKIRRKHLIWCVI